MLHPALTQKIDIFNSRAVIRYVEHAHTTCSLGVMSVSIHKMSYWKVVATCRLYLTYSSNQENSYL